MSSSSARHVGLFIRSSRDRAASIVVAAVLIFGGSVLAAEVHYFEPSNADLPTTGSPLPIFTLDNGLNSIGGDLSNPSDRDSFAFIVPAGKQIVDGHVTMPRSLDINFSILSLTWALNSGNANSSGGTFIENVTVVADLITQIYEPLHTLPLGPGTYNLTHIGLTNNNPASSGVFAFAFNVADLPEPTTLAALTPAVALLLRRRDRFQPLP